MVPRQSVAPRVKDWAGNGMDWLYISRVQVMFLLFWFIPKSEEERSL